MKKIFTIIMIAACAMMVYSCKNNNKDKENVPEDGVENCCENEDGTCEHGDGNCEKMKDAAETLENAADEAVERVDEALEKLDGILPYTSVEVKPTFKGGDAEAFSKYVQENIKYPQSAIDNDESGRVTVNFVVDANGKIKNAKVVKGVSEALDAEALRVIQNAPDWTPATQGGKKVPVTYSIPVVFALK